MLAYVMGCNGYRHVANLGCKCIAWSTRPWRGRVNGDPVLLTFSTRATTVSTKFDLNPHNLNRISTFKTLTTPPTDSLYLSWFLRLRFIRVFPSVSQPASLPNIDAVGPSRSERMPGKGESSDKEKHLESFLKIGLEERTARNTVANNKVTANLVAVIDEVFELFHFLSHRTDLIGLRLLLPSVWLPRKSRK
jgi:hypothetical protein